MLRRSLFTSASRSQILPGAATASRQSTLVSLPPVEERIVLPPVSQWKKHWNWHQTLLRDRVTIANPSTAAYLADSIVPQGSKDKIIIEAFPGPGALTRALMDLPKDRIKQIIVVEEFGPYLDWLHCLAKADSRVTVIPANAWLWDTYQTLQALGHLENVRKMDWSDGVHDQLHFVSHLAKNVYSEQLVAQLFRTIPDGNWLFQYGRVPMSFILTNHIHQRLSAPMNDKLRGKLSVITEATAQLSHPILPSSLQPFNDHFYPHTRIYPGKKIDVKKLANTEFQALNVIPHEHQVIRKGMLDKWDYVLRRLFVLKASDLRRAMPSLGPGAETLLNTLSDPTLPDHERVDIKKQIRKLTVQDWANIVQAFHRWPFAPEDLMITDSFINTDRRN